MKKLLIIRHAKADWPENIKSDFERPLHPQGEKDAIELGKKLLKAKIIPKKIVCSPSLRTKQTLLAINTSLKIAENAVFFDKQIYEAGYKQLLKVCNQFDNSVNFYALIGHNNGLSDLASYFTDEYFALATCACVLLEFPFDDWNLLSKNTAITKFYISP